MTTLGDFQQLAMLAVARLGEDAYGGRVQEELSRVAGREVAVSTVYVTLVRLERQGLVASTRRAPEDGRGRDLRVFRVTRAGWHALEAARDALARMWDGVEPA